MSHAPSLVRLGPGPAYAPVQEAGGSPPARRATERPWRPSRRPVVRAASATAATAATAATPPRWRASFDTCRCFEWTPPADWAPQWPLHTLVVSLVQVILFYATDSRTSLELSIPIEHGTEWRILTLTLAHADAAHLWGNLGATLSLVLLFEVIHGTPRTALLYWASGTFGSIAQVLLWRGEFGALLGASGAVYGVMGAYIAHLVLNLHETPLWPLWVCFAVLMLVLEAVNYAVNRAPNVAYAAHGFGALYGAVLALCVVRNVRVVPWERWFVYGGLVLSVVAGATAVALLAMRIATWEA